MSDSKKSERIVVDESILENLFGTQSGESRPEVEPEEVANTAPEIPAQSKLPEPVSEETVLLVEPAAVSESVPDEVVEATGGEALYDRESLLSRALMLDAESDARPEQVEGKPAPARRVKPARDTGPGAEGSSVPAAESHAVPADRLDDPEWQHARGNQLFANGNFSDAEESYRTVLKQDPESWSAHFNLGMILEQLNRHEQALAEYREARRIDGNRIEPAIRSGFIELRLGEYEDALATFTFALGVEVQSSRALFGKGCALHYLERLSEARECYKTLMKDHPGSEELLSNLAAACLALKDRQRALECAEKMPESAEEPEFRLQLQIECAIALGDEETVAQHSAQLVEMKEDSYEAWFNLGVACQRTGRLEVAVEAYKQALAVEPDRPEAQVNLGAVLHESENLVEARQFYEAALLSGSADHPGVNWNLGLAAESMGSFDVAEKAYAATVHSQPQWKEAVGRLTRLNPAYEAPR